MKVITPQFIESLTTEPAKLKIFSSGIGFNKAACKLLALKKKNRFLLCKDEKDHLFYQDVAESHDGFEITALPEKGGARSNAKGLFKFLFPTDNVKFKFFIIGEMKDGLRPLIPVDLPKKQ